MPCRFPGAASWPIFSILGAIVRKAGKNGRNHSRRGGRAYGEQDPDADQAPHALPALPDLDKARQADANDGISEDGDPSYAQSVRYESPDGAGDKRNDLIDEAEGADNIANAGFDVDEIGNEKGDGRVEENEERDAEQRYAQQVGRRLQRRRHRGERQQAADARHGFE
ncbi:hypothetical protein SCUP234_11664 [Seiridium cupressi]